MQRSKCRGSRLRLSTPSLVEVEVIAPMLLEFHPKERPRRHNTTRVWTAASAVQRSAASSSAPQHPINEDLHHCGEAQCPTHRGNIFQIVFEFVIGNFAGRDLPHHARNQRKHDQYEDDF